MIVIYTSMDEEDSPLLFEDDEMEVDDETQDEQQQSDSRMNTGTNAMKLYVPHLRIGLIPNSPNQKKPNFPPLWLCRLMRRYVDGEFGYNESLFENMMPAAQNPTSASCSSKSLSKTSNTQASSKTRTKTSNAQATISADVEKSDAQQDACSSKSLSKTSSTPVSSKTRSKTSNAQATVSADVEESDAQQATCSSKSLSKTSSTQVSSKTRTKTNSAQATVSADVEKSDAQQAACSSKSLSKTGSTQASSKTGTKTSTAQATVSADVEKSDAQQDACSSKSLSKTSSTQASSKTRAKTNSAQATVSADVEKSDAQQAACSSKSLSKTGSTQASSKTRTKTSTAQATVSADVEKSDAQQAACSSKSLSKTSSTQASSKTRAKTSNAQATVSADVEKSDAQQAVCSSKSLSKTGSTQASSKTRTKTSNAQATVSADVEKSDAQQDACSSKSLSKTSSTQASSKTRTKTSTAEATVSADVEKSDTQQAVDDVVVYGGNDDPLLPTVTQTSTIQKENETVIVHVACENPTSISNPQKRSAPSTPGEASSAKQTCSRVTSTVTNNNNSDPPVFENRIRKFQPQDKDNTSVTVTTPAQRNEYVRSLPVGFRLLKDLKANGQCENFFGVVTDLSAPRKSQGSDHYSKTYVVDPFFSCSSREIMWFDTPPYLPNIYRSGEIVVFSDIKCRNHHGELQLLKNNKTKIVVVPRNDDPELMKAARTPPQQIHPRFTRAIELLKTWLAKNSDLLDAVQFVSLSSALEVDEHVNLCVKLCKMVYIREKVIFTVWDGTIPSITAPNDVREKRPNNEKKVVFDVTSEFGKEKLIEVCVKGSFGTKNNMDEFKLKPRAVIALYGVLVKQSKHGHLKLVLEDSQRSPQGFLEVKAKYIQNPNRRGNHKFHFKGW